MSPRKKPQTGPQVTSVQNAQEILLEMKLALLQQIQEVPDGSDEKNRLQDPLSDILPLKSSDSSDEAYRSFFGNLIMEGRERELIGKAFHVSNVFGFLRLFGRDLIGGYTVEETAPSGQAKYIPVTRTFFDKGSVSVINAFDGYRVSLPGAQEKFAIFVDAHGDFFIPVHGAPSSHILKPDIYGSYDGNQCTVEDCQ